jgi:hypothetical protein
VHFDALRVNGDTVVLRSTDSEPDPFQRVNEFRDRSGGVIRSAPEE